jgi:hypothetical protein
MTRSFVTPKRCFIACAVISYVVPAVLWGMLSDTCLQLAFDSAWLAQSDGYYIEHRRIVGSKRPELNNPYWIDHYESNMQRMDRWDLFGYGLFVMSIVPTTALVLGATICQEKEDEEAREKNLELERIESCSDAS